MHLDREPAGQVTVVLARDDLLRLTRLAAEHGASPEAFVEQLTRDSFGRSTTQPKDPGPLANS